MSTGTAIIIVAEALLALAVVYGWVHERLLIRFERRMGKLFKAVAREIRRRLCERWLNRGDLAVVVHYGR